MKFVHAYVLCALSVAAQMKGADYQNFDEKQVPVKGVTELIESIPAKTRWTKTERQVDPIHTFVIFGSAQSQDKEDIDRFTPEATSVLERPWSIYPFRQTYYNKNEKKASIKTYEKAFRTYLKKPGHKEDIDNFSPKADRTFFEPPRITSSKSESKATNSFTFNPKTKQGYTTQVITQLTREIYPEAIATHKKELTWEIQKGVAALAMRYKQLGMSIEQAEQLQQTLNQNHQIMHDDFVFIVNVLIDDMKAHSKDSLTDQQAIGLLFEQEAPFAAAQARFNMLNQDTDEYIPDFNQFNDCYGKLPITIAKSAYQVYNSWWTSRGEPALATDLRKANYTLSTMQDSKEKEDQQTYIANLRARLHSIMIQHIRAFSDARLVDINDDLAEALAEEQKIAEQLQHILPKDIPASQAIEAAIGWPKNKANQAQYIAARLAKTLA